MKKSILFLLLLSVLLLSACSLPESGICLKADNLTYSDSNGGSGFLKIIECGNDSSVSHNVSVESELIDYVPIVE